jgi:hypothetical protein
MRRIAKWVGGILAGLILAILALLQYFFADPLDASMGYRKLGECTFVDSDGDIWRNEARYFSYGPRHFQWHGLASELDAVEQDRMTEALRDWITDPETEFGYPSEGDAGSGVPKPPSSCEETFTFARPAVTNEFAFVAWEHYCGGECGSGQIRVFRRFGFWWFPIAETGTWIA